jgi:hypothetical protein
VVPVRAYLTSAYNSPPKKKKKLRQELIKQKVKKVRLNTTKLRWLHGRSTNCQRSFAWSGVATAQPTTKNNDNNNHNHDNDNNTNANNNNDDGNNNNSNNNYNNHCRHLKAYSKSDILNTRNRIDALLSLMHYSHTQRLTLVGFHQKLFLVRVDSRDNGKTVE